MLRRTVARFDATFLDNTTFTARPVGVIPLNLRERAVLSNGESTQYLKSFCAMSDSQLSYAAPERPPPHFGQVNYLRRHEDLLTRCAVSFYQAGSTCCARCFVFLRVRTRFFATVVHLSAQPRSTPLSGFANGKFKNIKTGDGRIGLRRL